MLYFYVENYIEEYNIFLCKQRGPGGASRGHSGERGYRSQGESHHLRHHGGSSASGGGSRAHNGHAGNYRNAPPSYNRSQQHYAPKRK